MSIATNMCQRDGLLVKRKPVYIKNNLHKSLKELAAKRDKKIQELGDEAVKAYLRKNNQNYSNKPKRKDE